MKNKLLPICFLVLSSPFIFSQKPAGLEGKRFSIEAGVGLGFFSKYIYTNNMSDEMKEEGVLEQAIPTHRFNYSIGYVLTNKIQVQALFSHAKYKYGSLNEEIDELEARNYENRYHYHYHSFEDITMKGYGFKFSYYLHKFIAPVGGSIGFSFKRNFINVKNNTYTNFSNYEDDWSGYDYWIKTEGTGEFNIKVNVLSFHYENMSFLSSKAPIYFKYGIKMSLPFGAKGYRDGVEFDIKNRKGKEQGYYDEDEDYSDPSSDYSGSYRRFKKYSNAHDIFEFNLGLGIII